MIAREARCLRWDLIDKDKGDTPDNKRVCDFKPWKDTGTYILGGGTVDEIQTLLDDDEPVEDQNAALSD